MTRARGLPFRACRAAARGPVHRRLGLGRRRGIQADLKAFARCGVHGMTAITALTAQNTVGVTRRPPGARAFIVEQVRAVDDDIGVDAVKIGMLGDAETVEAVAAALDLLDPARRS